MKFSRRQFLQTAAAAPALAGLGMYDSPSFASDTPSPYLQTELDYANSHITKVDDIKKLDFEPVKVVDRTTIDGKVITGYQGWFNAAGDGSPGDRWYHWSGGRPPSLNIGVSPLTRHNSRLNSGYFVVFNMYPSLEEYDSTKLYQTDFPDLGNSNPATLFPVTITKLSICILSGCRNMASKS